jgi:multicomponent Na+:H+ antiporter subunit B
VLLSFMGATAVAILLLRHLLSVAMLAGIFSLLAAAVFVMLDAVDVAFTEAAVGAGVSTILFLATLALTRSYEKIPVHTPILPIVVVVLTGAVLLYATLGLPAFGDAAAPIHQHVAPRYIQDSPTEIGVPNMVTSVLASYRGYDTLGEVTVIFTAAIAVLALIGRSGRRKGGGE